MSLRDLMQRHARGPLVRLDHFGEEVVHIDGEGTETTVKAVVDRLDVEPSAGSPRVARMTAVVAFPRDGENGVGAVAKGDELRLAMTVGDDPVEARIRRIVSQDEAMFVVEVST